MINIESRNGRYSILRDGTEVIGINRRVVQAGIGTVAVCYMMGTFNKESTLTSNYNYTTRRIEVVEPESFTYSDYLIFLNFGLLCLVTVFRGLLNKMDKIVSRYLREASKDLRTCRRITDKLSKEYIKNSLTQEGEILTKRRKETAALAAKGRSNNPDLKRRYDIPAPVLIKSNPLKEKVKGTEKCALTKTDAIIIKEVKKPNGTVGVEQKTKYKVNLSNNNKATWDMLFDTTKSRPEHLEIKGSGIENLIKGLGGGINKTPSKKIQIIFSGKMLGTYEVTHGGDKIGYLTSKYAQRVKEAIEKAVELGYIVKHVVSYV